MTNPFVLNFLVNVILDEYFQSSRCVFIFSEDDSFEYKGTLGVVNLNMRNTTTINEYLIFRSFGCQGFLIHHQDASDILTQIEHGIKTHKDRFNFRKYLIVPPAQASEDNLMEIFNLTELQYIANFLTIVPTEIDFNETCDSVFRISCKQDEIFKLVTTRYVGMDNNNAPEILDLWFSQNYSFLYENNLYPDKITNQLGRTLRCATFNYKPYSIIEKSPPIARGSENSIAHEYAKYHNMTVQYITDDNEWGLINEDWTGNGILGNLAIGKADIGYGALYTWEHEYGFLDLSKPTVRTGITCLVPAPRLAAGWLTPLHPFSTGMWIGTGISYIFACLTTIGITSFITKKQLVIVSKPGRRNAKRKLDYKFISVGACQNVLRIFLIQSMPFTNKELTAALKHMFIVFLFSVLLTSSYSSGLSTIMTIPRYENSIETVWDLASSDLNWGATQDAWIFSILDEKRPQYVTIVDRFVATSSENLIERSETNKFAFSIERLPSGQYAIGSYVTENVVKKLRLMHEDLYSEYCLFMLPKSSPLLESLDDFVLKVFQAGLTIIWEKAAVEVHMDMRVQNIVKYYFYTNKKKQEGTIELKLVHVQGVFGILAIGLVLSGICFIIEICVHKYKSRRLIFAM